MNITFVDFLNKFDFGKIDINRKIKLMEHASLLTKEFKKHGTLNLNFICTHNSRRSILAQMICIGILRQIQLRKIFCYSSGLEASTVSNLAMEALKEIGFGVKEVRDEEDKFVKYKVEYNERTEVSIFSKLHTDEYVPKENVIAIMLCSDAEKNCPVLQNVLHQISLNYADPAEYDDDEDALQKYIDKCYEIGNELYFTFILVKKSLE
ncbi:MAG TPA: hypothetical protein PLE30_10060 [Candidatus Kapabacteria bacterium]|nr:hypothetical protein [Candidatus Kapabacteria bacterium]